LAIREFTMTRSYQVHYFGLLAERRGLAEERLESTAQTPAELYEQVHSGHPLGMNPVDFRVAVNDEFVTWDHPLEDSDRVAFLPPMSGG
jgi:molybdopterin synthase sulfur carrier subunit